MDKHIVRVYITDANNTRWEAPVDLETLPMTDDSNFYVTITPNPFEIEILRKSDNTTVFHLDPTSEFKFNEQDLLF
jgi:hypothetical protein